MNRKRSIDQLRRKTAQLLFLKRAALLAAVWGLVWGTAVIVLRAAFGQPRPSLWWGFAGLAALTLVAGYWAYRQLPSKSAFRAAIDRRSKMGGLLMAEESVDLGAWAGQMPEAHQPKLQWRGGKASLRLLGAALFVLASLLIPQRYVDATGARPLNIRNEADQLAKGIDALKEEKIEVEKVEELEEELNRLEEEATGEDPAKTWEALDHIEKELKQTAEEASEEALTQTENLTQSEALAESLLHEGSLMDESLLAESMTALAEMVSKAAMENEQLAESLSKGLEGALANRELADALRDVLSQMNQDGQNGQQNGQNGQNGQQNGQNGQNGQQNGQNGQNGQQNGQNGKQNNLSKEQMEALANALRNALTNNGANQMSAEQMSKLAEALRNAKGSLSDRLAKLNEAGLIPMDALKQCEKLGQCNSEGLAKFLAQCRGQGNNGSIQSLMQSMGQGMGQGQGMQGQGPGQAGISRGPGAAALSWKDPASMENAKFNAEVLPPSQLISPGDNETLQISSAAPQLNENGPDAAVDVLRGSQAGGGAAQKHQLLPRHKNAVKRYFQRSADSND